MDPVVVIGAVATVLGGFLSGVPAWFTGRRVGARAEGARVREGLEAQVEHGAKTVKGELADRFGWKASRVIVAGKVRENGDLVVQRCWRGVTPMTGNTIKHIGGKFWIGTPGGSIVAEPRLNVHPGFPKHVELKIESFNTTQCHYRVDVVGSLTEEDPKLDFDIEVTYKRGSLMTRQEAEEAYQSHLFKHDYLAFDIEAPVDDMDLEVEFPSEVPVSLHPFAFFGWSEIENQRELRKISGGFNTDGHRAKLTVGDPLIGLRYAIYWSLKN